MHSLKALLVNSTTVVLSWGKPVNVSSKDIQVRLVKIEEAQEEVCCTRTGNHIFLLGEASYKRVKKRRKKGKNTRSYILVQTYFLRVPPFFLPWGSCFCLFLSIFFFCLFVCLVICFGYKRSSLTCFVLLIRTTRSNIRTLKLLEN